MPPRASGWLWERKRGKLEEFNRLLAGDPATGFTLHEGARPHLEGVRYVVTLDVDTVLPKGALSRLVGTLAHPLNRAEFDDVSGRVRTGYTVLQPRVEISPECGSRSRFARWFTGDTTIDIYSRAVSDVYQDLFGSGIYVGKGAYDVEAFRRSLDGRVPENTLASHDLFEGIHGRAALATDIVLYETFPRQYLEFARRQHRWIRGDWQLLPWLARSVYPAPEAVVFGIVWRGSIDGRSSTTFAAACCRRRSSRCWSPAGSSCRAILLCGHCSVSWRRAATSSRTWSPVSRGDAGAPRVPVRSSGSPTTPAGGCCC
jgi:hypothetical protein